MFYHDFSSQKNTLVVFPRTMLPQALGDRQGGFSKLYDQTQTAKLLQPRSDPHQIRSFSPNTTVHSILFLDLGQIWFISLILGRHVDILWPVCGSYLAKRSVLLKCQHFTEVCEPAEGAWYNFVIWA